MFQRSPDTIYLKMSGKKIKDVNQLNKIAVKGLDRHKGPSHVFNTNVLGIDF